VFAAGHVTENAVSLGEDADATADGDWVALCVDAEHLDGAGGRFHVVEDDVDGRGLPGAVRAEKAQDLPLVDGNIDVLEGGDATELLGDAPDVEGGHTHRLSTV